MWQLIIAVVVVAVLAAVAAALKKAKMGGGGQAEGKVPVEKTPFKKNKYFLSNAEQSFYRVLKHVVGPQCEVFAKVRLLDVLWLPPQAQSKQKFRNMVQSKHLDFVLCDPKTLMPVVVVELDDSSHQRDDREAGDALKNRVLEDAGLPILRVKVQQAYDTKALGDEIQRTMGGPARVSQVPVAVRPQASGQAARPS